MLFGMDGTSINLLDTQKIQGEKELNDLSSI